MPTPRSVQIRAPPENGGYSSLGPILISARFPGTKYQEREGDDSRMYDVLKDKLLIFQVYDYQQEDNLYVIELIEVDKDKVPTHYGEYFASQGIVELVD